MAPALPGKMFEKNSNVFFLGAIFEKMFESPLRFQFFSLSPYFSSVGGDRSTNLYFGGPKLEHTDFKKPQQRPCGLESM